MRELDQYQLAYYNTHLEPNKVVLLHAVAGSGKTHTTLAKAIKLINEGTPPQRILLTSFTNNASRELAQRYNRAIQTKEKPVISTLHGLGGSLLKQIGNTRIIMNDWKSTLIVRDALKNILEDSAPTKLQELTSLSQDVLRIYSKLRNNSLVYQHSLEDDLKTQSIPHKTLSHETIISTILAYENAKTQNNLLDYDDMIWLPNSMVKSGHPQLTKLIDGMFSHLFIDEAQDLSQSQYDLILALAKGASLTMVGDICQSIYGFRDATPQNFSEAYMREHLTSNIETLALQNNYRSEPDIVKLCNIVRQLAKDSLEAIAVKSKTHPSVKIVQTASNIHESKYLVDKLKELELQGYKPQDITIICRTNRYIKSVLEPAMVNANLKYKVIGAGNSKKLLDKPLTRFFIDAVSYIINPKDNYALVSLLRQIKGIGQSNHSQILQELDNGSLVTKQDTITQIQQELQRTNNEAQHDPYSIVDNIISLATNYGLKSVELTEANIDLISLSVANYITILRESNITATDDILQAIVQESQLFESNEESRVYKLATVHSQKGCESPVVFAMGFNLQVPAQYQKDDEEANILYTQLSRAIKQLYIVDSREYITRNGDITKSYKNVFLQRLLDRLSQGT